MKKISEASIQAESVTWFWNNYCLKHHNPRRFIFSVPTELLMNVRSLMIGTGISSKKTDSIISVVMNKAKSTGMKNGISDCIILSEKGTFFIEFKLPGNNQQKNQKEFEEIVTNLGYKYFVVKSTEEFKKLVHNNII